MKRLIIAPHVDDDVLGCGGILDETCVVFYCGVDEHHVVDSATRLMEALAVAKRARHSFWWPDADSHYDLFEHRAVRRMMEHGSNGYAKYNPGPRTVNRYDRRSLIADFEHLLTSEEPDEVYIPDPASYNQDHQTAYNAAMVALRPHDELPFVKRILSYEQPHVVLWPTSASLQGPNYFRQIDAQEKLRRYRLMPSQVREHRSETQIVAMAQIRGKMANVPEAEAFKVVRWVE